MTKPFYITTAISYVNGPPHLGHAYEVIATDVVARFHRLDGREVWLLTGTDEHGQKVARTAREQGKEPRAFAEEIAAAFEAMTGLLNISNDDFIRTTEPRHFESSQAIWRAIEKNGYIEEGMYAGWYSVRDEAYFGEEELTKGEDGKFLAPSGAEAEWIEEPSYYFKLSEFGQRLLDHYAAHPDFIQPESRRNEIVRFIEGGLRDLSISRTTFDWGVPVPGAPGHVMYVWLDALTNYITGVGYPDMDSEKFKKYWPADVHMIGKDIVRFHAIYWPAFLMAAGIEPPRKVFGHGFLNLEGEKMSKSVGNVLSPEALVETYGLDQIRYFLLREVPFGQDGSFSHEAIVGRINNDLANDFGNLAQRVLSMVHKNCGGEVPEPGALEQKDEDLLESCEMLLADMREWITREIGLTTCLAETWRVIGDANRYVDGEAPWALKKTDPARMNTVLYVLADSVRRLALLTQPFMPDSSARMLDQLSVPNEAEARQFKALLGAPLRPGTPLPKPEGVFPRFVEDEA